MKKLILFLSFFILISFAGELQAQNQVNIKIKQPPPGQLNIENLWSFTLRNNTTERLEVYLKGTATEEKDGLIATGKTVSITLNAKETKNMKVSDLPKTPDIDYTAKDPKYKESLIRQGKFPAGSYEICVNVYSAGTNEELGSDCINQEVKETGLITLISPSDGDEIDSKASPVFIWTGKPGDSYKIKIVEILANQSPETAIEKNKAFFEKEGIKTTTFTYPTAGNKFEKGKKYAWVVKSQNTNSEIANFSTTIIGDNHCSAPTYKLTPDSSNGCCFNVAIYTTETWFSGFSIESSSGVQFTSSDISLDNYVMTSNQTNVKWLTPSSTYEKFPANTNIILGQICFPSSAGSQVELHIKWSTSHGQVWKCESDTSLIINCNEKPMDTTCLDFENSNSTSNWQSDYVSSIEVKKDPSDKVNNSNVLVLTDGSGPSIAWNDNDFGGNWLERGVDGCLCFDYKVDWNSNVSTPSVWFPIVYIYTGAPINNVNDFNYHRVRALFIGHTSNPPLQDNIWNKWCLAIAPCTGNNLPSNNFGYWEIRENNIILTGQAACDAWNNLIQNVTGVVMATDYNRQPSEKIYFDNFCWKCDENDPCNCGSWDSDKISVKGEDASGTVSCGQIINNSGTGNGINLQFPNFTCIGNNCSARYEWKITGPIPRSGTGNYIDNADFSQNGTYNIKVYAYCGDKLCDSCWIETTVIGKPCECSENGWKKEKDNIKISGAINKKISCGDSIDINEKNNITINIPEYECKPSSCPPDFKWEINNSNGSTVTSGSGDVINYTFATAGTYSISMIAKCNGLECDTCYIFIKVKGTDDCNCDYDENKVTINGVSYSFDCGEGYPENVFVNDNILFYPGLKCSNNCSVSSTSWILTGPNGFSTYGTSFPISLTPQVDGVYYLSSFKVCGSDTCRCITKIRAEKKSECDCRKGNWNKDKSILSYEIDKFQEDTPIKCEGKYTVNNKSSVTLNPKYICPPECGDASYSYKINGGAMTSPQTTPFVTPGIENTTDVMIYAWCGKTICDSCIITIIPKDLKCDCGKWDKYGTINYSNGKEKIKEKIFCNKEYGIIPSGQSFQIIYTFHCPTECPVTYDYTLYDENGNSVSTGSGVPMPINIMPTSSGRHRLELIPYCGKEKCEPCVIPLVIEGKEKCNCKYEDRKIRINGESYTFDCGEGITQTANINDNILINPGLVCNGYCSTAETSWNITGPNGYTSNGGIFPIVFTPPDGGVYYISSYIVCGTDTCRCITKIRVEEKTKCECNSDMYLIAGTVGKNDSVKIRCKETKTMEQGSVVRLIPANICNPADCLSEWDMQIFDAQMGTWIATPNGTGINSYYDLALTSPAGYRIVFKGLCGDKKCECEFWIRTKPEVCNCQRGRWDIRGSRISSNGVRINTIKCDSTYTVTSGSSIDLDPRYVCPQPNCVVSYSYKINGVNYPRQTMPFNIQSVSSNTNVTMYAWCGNTICDSCKITIIPKESPKCDCRGWINMKYSVTNGKSIKVTCNDTILLKGPSAITFNYGFLCNPRNCTPSINWEVIGPVSGSGPGINGFSYNFLQPGTYSVILKANCDGKSCPPCTLIVKVEGTTGCNCVIPNLPNVRIDPPNSAAQNVPCNSSFIQTFTTPGLFTITPPPVTCQGNGCNATYTWFINGQIVSGENNHFINNRYFGIGTYDIERRASCYGLSGFICFSCKFTLRVRKIIWPNGGFGGVTLGDIGTKKPDVFPTIFNTDRTLRPDFKWSTSGTSGKQKYFRIVEIIPREGTTDISDMEKDLSEKEPFFEVNAESNFLAYPKEMPELKKGGIYLWVVYELGDKDDSAVMLDVGLFQAGSDTPFLKGNPCEDCKKTCTNGACFWSGSGACICFERLPSDK